MVETERKQLPVQRPARFHKDNVMHLAEQRGCAVLRIASPRCRLTTTAEIYCQQVRHLADAIQENEQEDRMKWCSTKTPARTQLIWQKTLYRSWVGKSFRTHLIHLILRPHISPFLLSIEQHSRNFLSGWKRTPNMACWLQLKTTRFLQARNRKITPALAECCK